MWFRMPQGAGGISVAGQEFSPEAIDEDGFAYFRAPEHFAPMILGEDGFKAVGAPPGTDLPDLPKADPTRDSAIVTLTAKVSALEMERDGLQKENAALKAELEALKGPPVSAEVQAELDKPKEKK